MRVQLFKFLDRLRSSFWFLPGLMACAAVALALGSVAMEESFAAWLGKPGWIFSGGAEGASAVLSTIAASMITIAGVVFSVTLVALALTSQQFGPRLLRNFTRDTVTHVVMGTFVGTFLYCLMVLRSVRRVGEGGFVPHLSVSIGVLLAVASVGVLIYFIHHICILIQADEIVARVGRELIRHVDRLFPAQFSPYTQDHREQVQEPALPRDFECSARALPARRDGYIQGIEVTALMELALEEDLVLKVECAVGDYVTAGCTLVSAAPAERVTGEAIIRIRGAFAVGTARAAGEDIGYPVSQLVEIAVRALSPSLNDPFTAIRCIDRLGSGLSRLAQREMPPQSRCDHEGRVRLVVPGATFASLVDDAFSQIRPYAAANPGVVIRLLETIGTLARFVSRRQDSSALRHQAEMLAYAARQSVREQRDLLVVEQRYATALHLLAGRPPAVNSPAPVGSTGQ